MNPQHATPRWRRRSLGAATLLALVGGAILGPVATAASAEPTDAVVPTTPLITSDTSWRYLDDGTDPSPAPAALRDWTLPAYDDTAWKVAAGSFGAKNGKLAPVGPTTPRTLLNHYLNGVSAPTVPTYFFRTTFDLAEGVAEKVASLSADVRYDDALVVWVNGTEVARYVDARITDTTNQEYAGASAGDPASSRITAAADVLHDGTNTVAVALFQDRETSSDIFFDMSSLTLTAAAEPGQPVVAPPTRVILTPTERPETSQSFTWLAGDASHTVGQVEIAPAASGAARVIDAYDAGVANGNPNHHFSATVTGLDPATAYRYRVGLPGSWSDWFEFRTADPSATDFQFIYYGDAQIGLDTTWPSVVKQAEANAPRSIGSVHAGDLINTSSNETEWLNWFKGMKDSAVRTNVMAAPGNHEYSGDKLLTAWKANFEYPHNNPSTGSVGELANLAQGDTDVARQYRAFFEHWSAFAAETAYFTDYQGVRFITLNATRDTTFLTPPGLPACTGAECPAKSIDVLWTRFQGAWLDALLSQSPSKWNVVTFHQPVFSASSGRDEPVLRSEWLPIFQRNDIDLVLMGHDHVYARGFVNTDATDTPGLTTGPVYVVSNSGAKYYDLADAADNVWTRNGATQVLRGHDITTYQVIDVSKDQLVYRSYLAEKTKDSSTTLPVGSVYDQFTVTKSDAGEKWVTEVGVTPPVRPTPTPTPTTTPTTEPTTEPSPEPTTTPTTQPTVAPTTEPTATPTTEPTVEPTTQPTATPTTQPTATPTTQPTVAPTTNPTTAPSIAPVPVLTLSAATVAAAGTVRVSGSGFTPGAIVTLELHSKPVALGSITVDAAGAFDRSVTIPAGTPAGQHTLVAILPDGSTISAPLTVTAAASGALPTTGTELPMVATLTGVLIALAGAVLIARRRSAHSA